MKLLNSIHLYPPQHTCGAEFMAHWINKNIQANGGDVRVLLHQARHYNISSMYVYDGIDVFPPEQMVIEKLFWWADAVMTHLDYTDWTIGMGEVMKKPIFHLIHNTSTYGRIVMADRPQYIVYNSEWAKEQLGYKHDSIVVPPPVDWRHYDTNVDPSYNQAITLINLDQNKGGHILRQIAEAMPHKKFIGVMGSYSEPADIGQHVNQPPNVTIYPKTNNIKEIYRQTRILIMPSKYESWGRTATEAMCSGIPVISSGTPGLRENCGKAGIYLDRDDVSAWVDKINELDKPKVYEKWSNAAKKRSRELDPQAKLAELRTFMQSSIDDYKRRV
jgi:glycosyltransferase involved in cell wall biosynthesis